MFGVHGLLTSTFTPMIWFLFLSCSWQSRKLCQTSVGRTTTTGTTTSRSSPTTNWWFSPTCSCHPATTPEIASKSTNDQRWGTYKTLQGDHSPGKRGNQGKVRAKCFWWRSQGNSWKTVKVREKSGKNEIVLANIFKNVYIAHYISIFCQRTRIISVTFCYTAVKSVSGKNIWSQGKVREN